MFDSKEDRYRAGCVDNSGDLEQNFQLPPPPKVKVDAFYFKRAFRSPLKSLGKGTAIKLSLKF